MLRTARLHPGAYLFTHLPPSPTSNFPQGFRFSDGRNSALSRGALFTRTQSDALTGLTETEPVHLGPGGGRYSYAGREVQNLLGVVVRGRQLVPQALLGGVVRGRGPKFQCGLRVFPLESGWLQFSSLAWAVK
jgi:hypothetical protein